MKFTKKEVCALIIGKSIGEMQRIVRQYNYKFVIELLKYFINFLKTYIFIGYLNFL